jgi:hypothetical protein
MSRAGRVPLPCFVIPAKAGIHSSTIAMRQSGSRLSPG